MSHEIADEAGRQTFRILLAVVVVVALFSGAVGYLFGRFTP